MATLRPPSTSPSPSPVPGNGNLNGKGSHSRASMGPSNRISSGMGLAGLAPSSPRPGGIGGAGRPTSELLGSSGMFQTPEADAIDQWFENLQHYEVTVEEMAAASLDANFKEELSAIEQWFRVLSEAERTAALYSLLQHSTQVQIRFFITVLQQMARADPMTALLSPSASGSMQNQMEAKLNSMGLKSPSINSPSARNFTPNSAQRQSLAVDSPNSSFLSPDSANLLSPGGPSNSSDAAATLAQQRAKLKANAAHRISAPGTLAAVVDGARSVWSQGASQLGQVVETSASPSNDDGSIGSPGASGNVSSARPKSTDFSGVAASFRNLRGNEAGLSGEAGEQLSPMMGGSWASMVNTPLVPIFNTTETGNGQTLDNVASRLANWSISNSSGGKVQLEDAKKYRRVSKSNSVTSGNESSTTGVYDENGNLVAVNASQPGQPRNGLRSVSSSSSNGGNFLSPGQQSAGWSGGARSPNGFSGMSSNRFGSDDGGLSQLASMPGFGLNNGMGSPGMGLGMPGFGGMGGLNMNMLNAMNGMNMNMAAALHPDMQTQLLAAQLAANGVFNPGLFGMQSGGAGMRNMRGGGGRSPGGNKSNSGREGPKDKEEEVDPKLLEDIPAWLRSLRLHKYTPNFQNVNWRDMVVMDEAALEAKGVAALGARRKMLKTFETVRAKMGIEMPHPPAIPA